MTFLRLAIVFAVLALMALLPLVAFLS